MKQRIDLRILSMNISYLNLSEMIINKAALNKYIIFISLIIITGALAFFIVYKAQWPLSDMVRMISTGSNLCWSLLDGTHPEIGRFTPLGQFDYNILLFIPNGSSISSHFYFVSFSFIVFSCLFFFIIQYCITKNETSLIIIWIAFLTTLYIISRVYYPIFLDVIFPERLLIILIILFIYTYIKFEGTNKWQWGIFSLVICIIMIYVKEPIFGALIIFSLTTFLYKYKHLTKNQKLFHYILIGNSILFLLLYYFIVYKHSTNLYDSSSHDNHLIDLIISILRRQKMLALASIILIVRVFSFFFKKDITKSMWDSFLFAGIGYMTAIFILGLDKDYYFYPAIIFVTPSTVYFLIMYIKPLFSCILIGGLVILSFPKLTTIIQNDQLERQTTYPSLEIIADYVKEGKNIYWFENDISSYPIQVRDRYWDHDGFNHYINFILGNKKINFIISKDIKDIEANSILLYSKTNEYNKMADSCFISKIGKHREIIFKESFKISKKVRIFEILDSSKE